MSSTERLAPVLLVLAAILAGCATPQVTPNGPSKTALDQYAPKVVAAPDELGIKPHADGLSAHQQAALAEFAQRWRDEGQGQIELRRPAHAQGDDTDALRVTDMVVEYLAGQGVPTDQVRQTRYDTSEAGAPVFLRFEALNVTVPDCSKAWDNLTSTNSNTVSKHFGCAVLSNAAVQVANPRDLTSPTAMAASDATRRQTVLGKYRDGKITGAEKDEQSSAAVSKAVR